MKKEPRIGGCTLPPVVQPIAYRRDFSFYRSHGGSASKYHFLGKDLQSKCGRARILLTEDGCRADIVPEVLRCRAKGCRELWLNPSFQGGGTL